MHLLDVNALIALGWEGHAGHSTMLGWFKRHARHGWATCALTQAGFVRVLSQPALGPGASAVPDLAEALSRNLSHPSHRLLALDFGFDAVMACCTGGVVGHRQVTDAFSVDRSHPPRDEAADLRQSADDAVGQRC